MTLLQRFIRAVRWLCSPTTRKTHKRLEEVCRPMTEQDIPKARAAGGGR